MKMTHAQARELLGLGIADPAEEAAEVARQEAFERVRLAKRSATRDTRAWCLRSALVWRAHSRALRNAGGAR